MSDGDGSTVVILFGVMFDLETLFYTQGEVETCYLNHERSDKGRCLVCHNITKVVPKITPRSHWRDSAPVFFRKTANDFTRAVQHRVSGGFSPLTVEYWGKQYILGKQLLFTRYGVEEVTMSTLDKVKGELATPFKTLQLPLINASLFVVMRY